jgi:Phage tail protein
LTTIHNFKIELKDGSVYDMATLGLLVRRFTVHSPSPRHVTDIIEGRDGQIDLGTTYAGRKISADISMFAADLTDFALLRNEVFRVFDSRNSFYVIADSEPGKRWLVKVDGDYAVDQIGSYGTFSITFTSPLAYSESVGTTLDPFTFESEVWQTGGGLPLDETNYTHNTTTFSIYNSSDDVTINPRYMPLVIEFTGASTNLQISNTTTGDTWKYTGSTNATDIVRLDGVRSTKNGLSIFGNTNRKLITLAPGSNEFTITGVTGAFTISFDFRFYLL